jgi:hypothetical protein
MSVQQLDGKNNAWVDDYNQVIINVHLLNQCRNDYCTIHKPSEHRMINFPQRWRQDGHFMERVCPHGIGHPDPDEVTFIEVHGCDGCCLNE